jgi:hypothetical protein
MTAEEQAVVLVNEVRAERQQEIWKGVGDRRGYGIVLEALCRAIEQHEAFKQEVSDAAEEYNEAAAPMGWEGFDRFIIPKPDPLVEVIKAMQAEPTTYVTTEVYANRINAALDALGFEIREKGQ